MPEPKSVTQLCPRCKEERPGFIYLFGFEGTEDADGDIRAFLCHDCLREAEARFRELQNMPSQMPFGYSVRGADPPQGRK